MAYCLIAPNHYLNQCWLILSEVLWHSPEINFTASAQATILHNEVDNYTLEITGTSPRGQWVIEELLSPRHFQHRIGGCRQNSSCWCHPRILPLRCMAFCSCIYFRIHSRPPGAWLLGPVGTPPDGRADFHAWSAVPMAHAVASRVWQECDAGAVCGASSSLGDQAGTDLSR